MFSLYHDLYEKTDGFFTPLVGGLLSDAGYDTHYSLRAKSDLSIPPRWEDVLVYHPPTLLVKKPVLLDFGAAGKGYCIDLIGELLDMAGIDVYCINAGGDILYRNNEPIDIGLENPQNTEQIIGICTVQN